MPNNWTREHIIRHLLYREAKGLPMTVGGQGVDTLLYRAARRIFGSWRNAILAAGIAPQHILTWERWSPGRILVMIRHLARRDRPLTTDQIERRYHNLVTAARRHFGSWNKAILAAGVKPTRIQRVIPWSPERVIETILTQALRNESLVARLVERRSLVAAGQRFFGSWMAAVKAAGLDPTLTVPPPKPNKGPNSAKAQAPGGKKGSIPRWSKERVVEGIRARLRDQKPMYAAAVEREDQSLYYAARRHLRSWDEAMRAAGLDPDAYRRGPPSPSSSIDARRRVSVPRQSQTSETLRPDHSA